MELIQIGVTLKTLSPLHHGFTEPAETGEGGHKKTMRLVRQVALLLPNHEGQWIRKVVPVLGGNALRGRMRRVAAAATMDVLGITPEQFVANGRKAFHTITSGGTLANKNAQLKVWSEHPAYRMERIAEWPLLSLFGFSFDDFMERSKLRVHFGWPLIQSIRPAIEIAHVDAALFPESDWIDTSAYDKTPYLAMEGNLWGREGQQSAHYEYRHADDAIVPMPDTDHDENRDQERSGAVLAYQYVPAGIPFGVRMFAEDLTPLEQSLLRLIVESTFPTDTMVLFGGRSASGMGVFQVQRQTGLDDLPHPDVYREYLLTHRDRLVNQLLHDQHFLTDADALQALETASAPKKSAKSKKSEEPSS